MGKAILDLIKEFWRQLSPPCNDCLKGRVHYLGEDRPHNTWITIFQCDVCKTKYM